MAEVKKHVEVITQNGECKLKISLDININLNQLGVENSQKITINNEEESEQNNWAIPDFKMEKVKFGKKE